jgi:thymidine kinase
MKKRGQEPNLKDLKCVVIDEADFFFGDERNFT